MLTALTGTLRAVKQGPNSKPVRAPVEVKRRILFMSAILLISATLFVISISSGSGSSQNKLVRRKEDLGGTAKTVHHDPSMCRNADKMEICSHQILHAPPPLMGFFSSPSSSRSPPPDGSLKAMKSLWDVGGIRCFDVDVVTLQDGTLLASHPSRFASAVGHTKTPAEYTLAQAREEGADEVGFPILKNVLEMFASLVKTNGEGSFFHDNGGLSGMGIPQLFGPLLNLDLKGPNLSTQHLRGIEDVVESLGIAENVAICATALGKDEVGPGIDILRVLGGVDEKLPLGLVLRDRVETDKDFERVQALVQSHPAIKSLVPSNKFDTSYFDNVATLGMAVTAWTVDDESELVHAIKGGLSAVVSNYPMELSEKLREFRRRCSG
jgi:hypothetical protein